MPSHSGKRPHEMTTKRWSGGRNTNQRRDDRRTGSMHSRIMGGSGGGGRGGGGGGRLMVSPWENGMTPGMQSNMISQSSFGQQSSNSYFVNSGLSRGNFGASNYAGYGNSSKLRRYDRMGGYDDQRGRGLLPSPSPSNTPLLGVAPPAFPPAASGPEFLHQRIGLPWDSSFRSGGPRGMGSGYYPSDRGHQDKSRKFIKAKRPLSKPFSKGNSSRDGKGKARNSTSQSPSVKGREDKEKDSSHSKELKSKQGGSSLAKPERSTDSEKDDEAKNDSREEEEDEKDQKENGDEADKDETKEDKDEKDKQQEDPFPVKALYCHICELDSFSSRKGYIRHLQGVTHSRMAEMFHAKNAATLELLNISAKLSEMRQRDKVLRRTGKKGQPVMKTVEQILVQKWLKVGSCCGMKFKCPFGLEEHKLSIHHLKMKYNLKQKNEQKEKTLKEGEEPKEEEDQAKEPTEEDAHKEVVRVSTLLEEARRQRIDNPLTLQTLAAFDPSSMMGLEFIKEELRFRCTICRGQLFKSLENHCQSHAHFDNIASHLNKMEDAKREEERKQKEKEKETKKEEKKDGDKDAGKDGTKDDEDEEGDGELPGEYIMVDCSEDKGKSDDEMDEDVIPFGEDEERILNATEEEGTENNKEEEEEAKEEENEEETDEQYKEEIFEEIGEKIDLEEEEKKQTDSKKEEEEEEEEEEVAEPPPKKMAYTPRRRGRGRGRGKYSK